MMLRICHFLPVFQAASGVSTFAGEVANAQAAEGHAVVIATLPQYEHEHYPVSDAVHVVETSCGLEWREEPPDIVHVHGIWTPALHRVVARATESKIPIVWSPHGMLAPWAMRHKGWKKWPAWWIWQRRDLAKASIIHVTTELESGWVRGLGLRNRLSIVPLGTLLPRKNCDQPINEKIVLFVGRIYPVKGLVNLVKAWAILSDYSSVLGEGSEFGMWKLRIVGPDEAGHKAELERLIKENNLGKSVEFAGAEFGEALGREYDRCECLVLPSFTENFGATVLEALSHGKPCIASTFTPWRELSERECGWWVSNEPTELAKAIGGMIDAGDTIRRQMGARGRKLVEEKYSWSGVASQLLKEYESLLRIVVK